MADAQVTPESVDAQAQALAPDASVAPASPQPQQAAPDQDADALGNYLAQAQGGGAPDAAQTPTGDAGDVLGNYLETEQAKARDEQDPDSLGKALSEGAAEGVAGPLAPLAERLMGAKPEDLRARAEAHPYAHGLGEVGGFLGSMLTGTGEAGLIARAGAHLVPYAAESLAGRIGVAAAKGVIENAMFAGGDEISNLIKEDPTQTAQTALAHIGLGAALGGSLGGLTGGAAHLWNVKSAPKAGQAMADFADRVNMHLENPDLTASATKELTDLHNRVSSYGSELFGANGLKAEEIAKAVPEMNDAIAGQASDTYSTLLEKAQDLAKKGDKRSTIFSDLAENYGKALETNKSADVFNATQDLKRTLASDAEYNVKFVDPEQRAYRNAARDVATKLKGSLEDTDVWGKAGDIQKQVNAATSKFIGPLKDFNSAFTRKGAAFAPEVDPDKVLTFANKVGKDKGFIQQKILKTFLDKASDYEDVVHGLHVNAGIESPVVKTPLNATNFLLKERTLGGKLADTVIQQGLSDAGSKAIGAGIGAGFGHALGGLGEAGALFGGYAFGPLIKKTLPLLIKPALTIAASGRGLRSGAEMVASTQAGSSMLSRAAKAVFSGVTLPANSNISTAALAQLDKHLQAIQEDPSKLQKVGGDVAHYFPDHGTALASTATNAANVLNQLRPKTDRQSPLDMPRQPTSAEKAQYKQALTIANDPTTVLGSIANGSITPQQISLLKAIYPSTYNAMVAKLSQELNKAVQAKTPIPYKLRQGISLFTGQPVDSSMIPTNIQAAQAVQTGNQQQQAPQGGGAPKRRPAGTKALQNFGKAYQTPAQAAEEDQGKR